jgi:hypothetical protein
VTQKREKQCSLLVRFFLKPLTVTRDGVAATLARDSAESVPSLGPSIFKAVLKSTLDFIGGFDIGLCALKVFLTSRPEGDIFSRICEPRYAKSILVVNLAV